MDGNEDKFLRKIFSRTKMKDKFIGQCPLKDENHG